jgi:Animal haem peroxidase
MADKSAIVAEKLQYPTTAPGQMSASGGGLWRPKSSRQGIGPIRYVWWNSFYAVMEFLNRKLARDPNRKVSWDRWPPPLGLLYLLAKIRFNRSNAMTDPYDYESNDTKPKAPEPEAARHYYSTDGTYVSDRDNSQMGAANTRFGSNIPPKKVRPDVENMTPPAREAAKLRWRRIDPETGSEITVPALILNSLAAGWIQFNFHSFGGNTLRNPVALNPHRLARDPKDGWPSNEALIDRTRDDPTRVTNNGRPTPISERDQTWSQAQVYGSSDAEQAALRSFQDGKLRLDTRGRLPEDPNKPGVDLTGFNHNFNPVLSLLHWLMVVEHNAIADHFRYFHPDWDDEKLFQMARKTNAAQVARIHTDQWTRDLLQHEALQIAMHADWYGLIGKPLKMFLMRLANRRPWVNGLLQSLRNNDFLWGMPGSKWEHHDGPFQVPKHFRMVYRLHEMILSEYEIREPGTDRMLDRISLIDFVNQNTRGIVDRHGYESLAWSFVSQSAGALTLHNFPRALTKFQNQQDGTLTDLAERDLFRERTDGTGTYNEFRQSMGEPPVTSFLELTGGDAELAREVEIKYQGDVEKVDAGIGILAEPKPAGFALGFTQFYQFVLNAPRRLKSNRHLSVDYTYQQYQEGMDWAEHGGGISGILARHVPGLRPLMDGVVRWFMPWPDTETFPLRMLTKCEQDTANVFKSEAVTSVLGAVAVGAAAWVGALAPWLAVVLWVALAILPLGMAWKRMLAMRFMQQCWKRCYTDKRAFMFGTLTRGEQWINRAAFFGRLEAKAVLIGAGVVAAALLFSNPLAAALMALAAVSAIPTWRRSSAFARDAQVLKISLRNRMREGQPVTDATRLPGDTALQKRYWFLKGDNEKPVATFGSMYRTLRNSGLPVWTAFATTVLSLWSFGRKTQRGMSTAQKRAAGIGFFGWFKIYLPNISQAQSYSSTRVYAPADNAKGLKAGELDMAEFERAFRLYAPGRDYLTAYDFARMGEGNQLRDAREKRGNWWSRRSGRLAAKRRAAQLFLLFADRVVEEDFKLVPAVSREMLLRFYQGAAQYDLLREHEEGDLDPSPLPTPDTRD